MPRSSPLSAWGLRGAVLAAMAVATLTACGSDEVSVAKPTAKACRVLTPADSDHPSNNSPVVDCSGKHTAETFLIESLPADVAGSGYDTDEVGAYVYSQCEPAFGKFVGADESLVMRTVLNWSWFLPSQEAWDAGARWFRCDLIGGGPDSQSYESLPETGKNLLLGKPDDRWMVCGRGETVDSSVKVPCSDKHDWRAVTTIKLGQPGDAYPGDRVTQARTREFCSDSVGAWLEYPVTYDFGYTWFHEAEWKVGNRRSVCWAKTTQ